MKVYRTNFNYSCIHYWRVIYYLLSMQQILSLGFSFVIFVLSFLGRFFSWIKKVTNSEIQKKREERNIRNKRQKK